MLITNLKEFLAWRGFAKNDAPGWMGAFYDHMECGPWAELLVPEGGDLYRGLSEGDLRDMGGDPPPCVGIRFGCIVEGSDAYCGPYEHLFPFRSEDFDADVGEMERASGEYWERDNMGGEEE